MIDCPVSMNHFRYHKRHTSLEEKQMSSEIITTVCCQIAYWAVRTASSKKMTLRRGDY